MLGVDNDESILLSTPFQLHDTTKLIKNINFKWSLRIPHKIGLASASSENKSTLHTKAGKYTSGCRGNCMRAFCK